MMKGVIVLACMFGVIIAAITGIEIDRNHQSQTTPCTQVSTDWCEYPHNSIIFACDAMGRCAGTPPVGYKGQVPNK